MATPNETFSPPASLDALATEPLEDSVEILKGNPNAVVENLDVDVESASGSNESGTMTGTLTADVKPTKNANENAIKSVETEFSALFTVEDAGSAGFGSMQGSCEILTLTLGPLDLNLLGLRVQLNRVNLRVTGQTGSNKLLGNLLCSIAGLLDPA